MKIYRVHKKRMGWESDGFEYFLLKRDAKACLAQNIKDANNSHDVEDEDEMQGDHGNIEVYEFPMTKQGVIELLNKIADHPDNG